MAIIQTPSGPPVRSTTGSTTLTIGAQGQPVAMTSTNNTAATSPNGTQVNQTSFNKALSKLLKKDARGHRNGVAILPSQTAQNQLIINLDAQFDILPNQAAWNAYAAGVAGNWQLCADCEVDQGGKKLFRAYNFYRFIFGLPLDLTPPLTSVPPSGTCASVVIFGPMSGDFVVINEQGPDGQTVVFIAQIGKQLSNAHLVFPNADNGVPFYSGSPQYDWAYEIGGYTGVVNSPVPDHAPIKICTALPDGTPGSSNVARCSWTP